MTWTMQLNALMAEYRHVEKPFLDQLAALVWTVIDQRVRVKPDLKTLEMVGG